MTRQSLRHLTPSMHPGTPGAPSLRALTMALPWWTAGCQQKCTGTGLAHDHTPSAEATGDPLPLPPSPPPRPSLTKLGFQFLALTSRGTGRGTKATLPRPAACWTPRGAKCRDRRGAAETGRTDKAPSSIRDKGRPPRCFTLLKN